MRRLRLILAANLAILMVMSSLALAQVAPKQSPEWDRLEHAFDGRDYVEARRIAEKLAQDGDSLAMNYLSVILANGLGGPADQSRASALLERAAAAGVLVAKLNLAVKLAAGSDERQWPRAVDLMQEVAKDPKLAPEIYYPMGRIMLFSGKSDEERRQGIVYLRKAADASPTNSDAQFLVARAYLNGWGGTEKNPKSAVEHFQAAANLGDARALRFVGMARLYGNGAEKDPTTALVDLKAAAERGNVMAMIDVAVVLALGEGVPADPHEARKWYDKAAKLGSAHALRGLGAMLYNGEGGPVDRPRGQAYLELAAEGGDIEAPGVEQKLLSKLSPVERMAVDQLKSDWLSKNPKPRPE